MDQHHEVATTHDTVGNPVTMFHSTSISDFTPGKIFYLRIDEYPIILRRLFGSEARGRCPRPRRFGLTVYLLGNITYGASGWSVYHSTRDMARHVMI